MGIRNNSGISAKGVDNTTLDGISLRTLKKISDDILGGNFKFTPVRRVYIPKPGKTALRPLGVSSPREKIVQKAIELVLTAIFEEIYKNYKKRKRPGRGCHT